MGTTAQLSLPPLLDAPERHAFAGREAPLRVLHEALEQAASGHKRLVLISGEPGIGKTRLAAELGRSAHAEGANVLFGRCDEEALLPYQPFVETLRFYVANTPSDALMERLGRGGADVPRIVPELRDLVPDLDEPIRGDAEDERYRLLDGVTSLLEAASQERPLVLLFDDLHWADRPTLALLRHLVRSPEPSRLLVVGTYRETELDRAHPLTEALAELRREEAHERLALRGLEAAETGALLLTIAPHVETEDSVALIKAVQDETDGNPFFLLQTLQHYFSITRRAASSKRRATALGPRPWRRSSNLAFLRASARYWDGACRGSRRPRTRRSLAHP